MSKDLHLTFEALARHKLSIPDAHLILDVHSAVRATLVGQHSNPFVAMTWRNLELLARDRGGRSYQDHFESSESRLLRFVASPAVYRSLAQTDSLPLRSIVREGHLLLADLRVSDTFEHDDSRVIGTLLLSCLLREAFARPEGSPEFPIVIDEIQLFVVPILERFLFETRKFSVPIIGAARQFSEFAKAGESIVRALKSIRTQITLRQQSRHDADELVASIFAGELDTDRPRSFTRPSVVGVKQRTFRGTGATEADHDSASEGVGSSTSTGDNAAFYADQDGALQMVDPGMRGQSANSGSNEFASRSQSKTRSRTESETQGLEPIFADLPVGARSLEEQREAAAAYLMNLPDRVAVMKTLGRPAVAFFTHTLQQPYQFAKNAALGIAAVTDAARERMPYGITAAEADRRIAARLAALARPAAPPPEPDLASRERVPGPDMKAPPPEPDLNSRETLPLTQPLPEKPKSNPSDREPLPAVKDLKDLLDEVRATKSDPDPEPPKPPPKPRPKRPKGGKPRLVVSKSPPPGKA